MPAIASLEDLKAAQKEGLSIYAMRYALCRSLEGAMPAIASLTARFLPGLKRSVPQTECSSSKAILWLRWTPEKLKGEGG